MPRIYSKKRFLNAIRDCYGSITLVASRVGCDWHTAKNRIYADEDLRLAFEDEMEKISDYSIMTLVESIKSGDKGDAKWWLSHRRRKDFGDGLDLTSGGQVIRVIGVGINVDEL